MVAYPLLQKIANRIIATISVLKMSGISLENNIKSMWFNWVETVNIQLGRYVKISWVKLR